MKIPFYSFILLFIATSVYAQKTVSYVSFFPPANVVHSEVILTQNTNSFSFNDAQGAGSEGVDYTSKLGGLVLGAAPNSEINISTVTVAVTGDTERYAILNFKIDNIIKLSSNGALKNVTIGNINSCQSGEAYCGEVKIFANDISLPFITIYPDTLVTNVWVADNVNIATNFSYNNFIPGLSSGDKLKWVTLRVNGTEECRKYLVKYQGSAPNNTACRGPSWFESGNSTLPDPVADL